MMFNEALNFYVDTTFDDIRKGNALETLVVILRSILQKDFAGWEIMDLLAGNMSDSDQVFGVRSSVIMKGPIMIDLTLQKLVEGIEIVLESTESSGRSLFSLTAERSR
jgi:hypothetical protein